MKKSISFLVMFTFFFVLSGCDIIEEEIERAQSIEFEDVRVDIGNRNLYVKITADADEPVIEDVEINESSYELEAVGDDWYLLTDIPIETEYTIDNLYYRTGVGVRLSYGINESLTLQSAFEYLSDDELHTLDETLALGDYSFSPSDEALVSIDSDKTHDVEEFAEWVWVVIEDDVPLYAIVEIDDAIKIITLPQDMDEYLE